MSDQQYPYEPVPEPTQPHPTAPLPQPYPQGPYPTGPVPAVPYRYAPVQVAPKSPALALLVSFFIPGVGSMINGEVGKGIAILLGYLVSYLLVVVLIGIFGVLGFWIWGMVDAYQGAQQWNRRHGILS
jgi:TM2 domain-containing membrane protein YozV